MNLCAISYHYGSVDSGHYTAAGKRETDWWLFNDASVSKTDPFEKISEDAYLFFYSIDEPNSETIIPFLTDEES
jgi:ubiquitin C-terminal hydrolase